MLHDFRLGCARAQKELPPKYFYDARGSQLFAEITRLEEYYPTRLERALLGEFAAPWLARSGVRALVELGAGNADKTRTLLRALPPGATYAPVDISREFLQQAARRLRSEFSALRIAPAVADLTRLPAGIRPAENCVLFAFLGSTIGNFTEPEAVALLRQLRERMQDQDALLLGADLVKDPAVLELAYNDERGVTAEFNRNVLRVLNRELGTDFQPDRFRHVAFYDSELARIEMHLLSLEQQDVHVPGGQRVRFARGETLRTEVSCKYTRDRMEGLLSRAGLRVEHWVTDPQEWYALLVARPVARGPLLAQRAPMDVERAADWIREHLVPRTTASPRVGLEYELLVQHRDTHLPALWQEGAGPLARWLTTHARRERWRVHDSAKGAPKYELASGVAVTLEPGGQLEITTPPQPGADAALARVEQVLAPLQRSARSEGLELLAVGLDPHNDVSRVPLQFDSERYRRMDAYLGGLGEEGRRMMRQTASLQINLDINGDVEESWCLANALAPYLVVRFANTQRAGVHSERARIWSALDPARTGVFAGRDCAREYARFALTAQALLTDGLPFGAHARTMPEWEEHLSTLFPEVRLRGYLELRTLDSLPLERARAAVRMVCGLFWDEGARAGALALAGSPDPRLMDVAWREGPENETLRVRAERLEELGLAAYERLTA